MKDWIIRAIKTFIQSFISYFFINWGMIEAHFVNWDFSNWKTWLLPLIGGALSAAICAVWNFILEKKEGPLK